MLVLNSCWNHKSPAHVTPTKILEVEIGMSPDEVVKILREPIKAYGNTFQYTKAYAMNYPMLWIHFDSTGVHQVYAKFYDIADDQGVYGLTRDSQTGQIKQWGVQALYTYFD